MPRPVILGVVGDSAAGKTTITRGLVRVLGEDNVAHICIDDYHRYDRRQRAELGITPLHPDCNHLDIIAQHLGHLRAGDAILKPVYRHQDGTFGPPVYVRPERFTLIEGLLGYYLPEMCDVYDVRVFLNPPELLRRKWKVQRDCSRRATPPTRCWRSWIGASLTAKRSSVPSAAMPTCWFRSWHRTMTRPWTRRTWTRS